MVGALPEQRIVLPTLYLIDVIDICCQRMSAWYLLTCDWILGWLQADNAPWVG